MRTRSSEGRWPASGERRAYSAPHLDAVDVLDLRPRREAAAVEVRGEDRAGARVRDEEPPERRRDRDVERRAEVGEEPLDRRRPAALRARPGGARAVDRAVARRPEHEVERVAARHALGLARRVERRERGRRAAVGRDLEHALPLVGEVDDPGLVDRAVLDRARPFREDLDVRLLRGRALAVAVEARVVHHLAGREVEDAVRRVVVGHRRRAGRERHRRRRVGARQQRLLEEW